MCAHIELLVLCTYKDLPLRMIMSLLLNNSFDVNFILSVYQCLYWGGLPCDPPCMMSTVLLLLFWCASSHTCRLLGVRERTWYCCCAHLEVCCNVLVALLWAADDGKITCDEYPLSTIPPAKAAVFIDRVFSTPPSPLNHTKCLANLLPFQSHQPQKTARGGGQQLCQMS